jgi:hypothetical protein
MWNIIYWTVGLFIVIKYNHIKWIWIIGLVLILIQAVLEVAKEKSTARKDKDYDKASDDLTKK